MLCIYVKLKADLSGPRRAGKLPLASGVAVLGGCAEIAISCSAAFRVERSSPPTPIGAMAVAYLKYRVVAGIVEPTAELSTVQRAQPMIEDAPVPTWCAAADGGFSV